MGEKNGFRSASIEFGTHLIVGTLLFSVMALAAASLQWLVRILEGWQVSSSIITALHWLELIVFYLDATCFVILLVCIAVAFVRDVFREAFKK